MGIGVALATGLVQGFTQNMGREMERRAGEREKLEGYRNLLYGAAAGDPEKTNIAGINMLRDMVGKAQGNLEQQKGIDIFGTASDSIFADSDDDFSKVLAEINLAAKEDDIDENRVFMDDGSAYYTFNREVRKAANNNDAIANLNEITFMIGHNEAALNKWINAPESVKEDILQVARFNATAIATAVEASRPEGQDILGLDIVGLTPTTDALDRLIVQGIPDYTGNLIGSAFRKLQEKKTGEGDGNGSSGSTVFTKTGIHNIDAPVAGEEGAYTALFGSFGVKDGDLDALNMSWSKYTNIFGMTDADSDALWDRTIQFMTTNGINTQFQDSTAFAMLEEDLAKDYLQSLRDITNNDTQQMSLIIGALYTPRQFTDTKKTSATRVGNTGSQTITEEDIRLYTAKVMFGAYATEEDFQEIVNQDKQLAKVLSEGVGLGALLNIVDKEMQTIPLAYQVASKLAGAKNLIGFVFGGETETTKAATLSAFAIERATDGKTIIISDDGTVVAGKEDQKVIDEGEVMTTQYIDTLNAKIEAARQRARTNYNDRPEDMKDMSVEAMEEMYARFESLRISLAFQMARAADPSGRLSDQDVKQMMALLSGDINTPAAMKIKIKRAMDEFEYQRQRFAAVIPFAETGGGKATRIDKLRVHGVHGLDILSKKAGFLGSSDLKAEAAASQKLEMLPAEGIYGAGAIKIGDTIYMPGGNGTWHIDQSGFPAVTDPDLLKKLNEAMPET